jgi:hypothetical protein
VVVYVICLDLTTCIDFSVRNAHQLDFITEVESVYCAVGGGSLSQTLRLVLKGLIYAEIQSRLLLHVSLELRIKGRT